MIERKTQSETLFLCCNNSNTERRRNKCQSK
nr:MAG TPA: hypothetical protein [Caudoviricetes sp.]